MVYSSEATKSPVTGNRQVARPGEGECAMLTIRASIGFGTSAGVLWYVKSPVNNPGHGPVAQQGRKAWKGLRDEIGHQLLCSKLLFLWQTVLAEYFLLVKFHR